MTGNNTVGVQNFRVNADYRDPLAAPTIHPFRVVHRWTEHGQAKTHIVDRGPVGIVPSEISLLHEILGLRERAHQPISHGHHVPALRFEVCFRIRFVNRHRSDHLGMTMNCDLGTPDLDPLASLAVTESIFQGREEPGHC